ncbi:MAG: TldD/PmbA family protein [Myxococcales bacterium]|nr:TldD/PmbA family protein [Myxococcales bacterium]
MDIERARDYVADRLREHHTRRWEIFTSASDMFGVEVKKGEVDSLKAARAVGLSVRVLDDARLGFAYSTSFEPDALAGLVESALAAARATEPDEHLQLAPALGAMPGLPLVDAGLALVPRAEKIEAARRLEAACLGFDPVVKRVRTAAYSETTTEVAIRNSEGLDAHYRRTGASTSVLALAEDPSGNQTGWEFDFGLGFADLDFESVGRRAAERAKALLGAKKVKTARCPVVIENGAVTDLLGVLSSSFLASNVQRGKSMLARRLGEQAMSPAVTIVDDGLLPRGAATAPFDDEGVVQQTTELVAGGVVREFLFDLYTAHKAGGGRASTGNASRAGVKGPPGVGTTNLLVRPGEKSLEELLAEMGEGMLLTDFMGIHTANPISGDFSVGASGFWVKGGVVVHPVTGVAVAGNILQMFADVVEAGSDLRMFGATGAPSLLVKMLSISGD